MQRFPTLPLLLVGLIMLALAACTESDSRIPPPDLTPRFSHEGLDGRTVFGLYQVSDTLIATTDAGLFAKSLLQRHWTPMGLADHPLLAFVALDDNHYLASILDRSGSKDPALAVPRLMETLNGGSNWQEVSHDFGGEQRETIHALYHDDSPGNGTLWATGLESLAYSVDLGRTWQLAHGHWDAVSQPMSALKVHPGTGHVWYGGQNAIEQMVLRRYDPVKDDAELFPEVLPAPAVIYDLLFDERNPNRILASGEGGIVETLDDGATWTNLLGDVGYRFYFQLAADPQLPDVLYTAGWDKNFDTPQPLILEVSRDGGATWLKFEHPDDTLFGGVRSVLAVPQGRGTAVYLGLYGGGIMRANLPRQR
ncbi:MAG: hypothetical protein LAT63_03145 [Marinobacter sp.]|nr:hypothetical protein [Marinobacter sp.]